MPVEVYWVLNVKWENKWELPISLQYQQLVLELYKNKGVNIYFLNVHLLEHEKSVFWCSVVPIVMYNV